MNLNNGNYSITITKIHPVITTLTTIAVIAIIITLLYSVGGTTLMQEGYGI